MKRLVYIFAVLLFGITSASAQKLIIEDCDAPLGGVVKVAVKYQKENKNLNAARFNLDLPEGLSLVMDTSTEAAYEMDASNSTGFAGASSINGFAVFATGSAHFAGDAGTLLTFQIQVDKEKLSIDDVVEVTVRNISVSDDDKDYDLDQFTFKVTIVDNITILDDESEDAPTAAENVKVKVLRTINANNWSTICLPFAMTEEQVVAAFKEDVKIAEFTGCTFDDDAGNIMLDFTSKSTKTIEANHPYLIKVSEAITHDVGFTADKVTIAPEDEPVVEVDGGTFIGTYEKLNAIGTTRKPALFIANNQFWFSYKTASLKPYRGYFEIEDLKEFVENAKVGFLVNDELTYIDGFAHQQVVNGVYDLSGRKIKLENGDVTRLQKGVYIIDGKKVTIK